MVPRSGPSAPRSYGRVRRIAAPETAAVLARGPIGKAIEWAGKGCTASLR